MSKKTPWNKGKKLTKEHVEKLSLSRIGKRHSEETKRKMSLKKMGNRSRTGQTQSIEERLKKSLATKGEKSVHWRGGHRTENLKIRNSIEYRLWRESVFSRDKWTCIWCGKVGGKINADHIKPFAYYPELRFAIDNGRTLCVPCHRTTDTWGVKAKKHLPINTPAMPQ